MIESNLPKSTWRQRVWNWLSFNGIALFTISILFLLFAVSLHEAKWVENDPFGLILLWGFIFGVLLAVARFRGWFAAIYSLILGIFIILQTVGGIIPDIGRLLSVPFLDFLILGNLRLWLFIWRVQGWVQTLNEGNNLQDTGLFVLLLGLLIFFASIWLVWWALKVKNAVISWIPLAIFMVINAHLSGQGIRLLFWFGVISILFFSSIQIHWRISDWDHRKVDYPYLFDIIPTYSATALILGFIVAVFAWSASLFASQEGLRILSDTFDKTFKQASQTAEQLFGGVRPPQVETKFPFFSPPDISDIGLPPSQDTGIVFWVKTNDPAPPPLEAHLPESAMNIHRHYWRSGITTEYTGSGWKQAPANQGSFINTSTDPPPGHYLLSQKFDLIGYQNEQLFSANNPIMASAGIVPLTVDSVGSILLKGKQQEYEVTSWVTAIDGALLDAAPTIYPDSIRNAYLQLPESLPTRIHDLTTQIVGGATSPYEKAIRIQTYLRETYKYDLSVPPAPKGQDSVDYFLFDAQRGFCTYFASAMAVMLRAEGIPARVATGYANGTYDFSWQAYFVTADLSHSWVEVFFPGFGWIEFEPTPAQPAVDYGLPLKSYPAGLQPPKPAAGKPVGVPFFVVATTIFIMILFSWALSRYIARRKSRQDLPSTLYNQIQHSLKLTGFNIHPAMTPDEFLEQSTSHLSQYPRLGAAAALVTNLYIQSTFSPRSPSREEILEGEKSWRDARWEWIKLWIRSRVTVKPTKNPDRVLLKM